MVYRAPFVLRFQNRRLEDDLALSGLNTLRIAPDYEYVVGEQKNRSVQSLRAVSLA